MKILSRLYRKILKWAESRYAVYALGGVSFFEAAILPYPPPDVILAPMVLQNRKKAYRFALICTLTSVLGGVFGYLIGAYAYDLLLPFLTKMDYLEILAKVQKWFLAYDIWIIAIAGFSPVPYKIFTIGAGVMTMALLPFVLVSVIARGARFFLVAYLVKKFGPASDKWLHKNIDRLGYILIFIIVLWFLIF